MDDIYNLLSSYLAGCNHDGIDNVLAHFFLSYLKDVPSMRVADVAMKCHTSEPSVVRFCRHIGCQGYLDFRNRVTEYLENVEDKYLVSEIDIDIFDCKDSYEKSINKWLSKIYSKAKSSLLGIPRNQMLSLAEDIMRYMHVYIYGVGLSGLIAERLRIHLARVGKTVITVSGLCIERKLVSDRKDTLGIIFSQQGRICTSGVGAGDLHEFLNIQCDKTWLITQADRKRYMEMDNVVQIHSWEDMDIDSILMLYFEELLIAYCLKVKN